MHVSEKLMKKVLENGEELWYFGDHEGFLYKGKKWKKPKIFVCIRRYTKEGKSEPVVCYTAEQFKNMAEDVMELIKEYEGMTENLTD